MNNINPTSNTEGKYNYYDSSTGSRKSNDLDKDAFLSLLVTQLQNQDPLSPMEDREFISQMAQFSSLEQIQNLNETMQAGNKTIADHITMMNNNFVKSQTSINDALDSINKTLGQLVENMGLTKPEDPENPDLDGDGSLPEDKEEVETP